MQSCTGRGSNTSLCLFKSDAIQCTVCKVPETTRFSGNIALSDVAERQRTMPDDHIKMMQTSAGSLWIQIRSCPMRQNLPMPAIATGAAAL